MIQEFELNAHYKFNPQKSKRTLKSWALMENNGVEHYDMRSINPEWGILIQHAANLAYCAYVFEDNNTVCYYAGVFPHHKSVFGEMTKEIRRNQVERIQEQYINILKKMLECTIILFLLFLQFLLFFSKH